MVEGFGHKRQYEFLGIFSNPCGGFEASKYQQAVQGNFWWDEPPESHTTKERCPSWIKFSSYPPQLRLLMVGLCNLQRPTADLSTNHWWKVRPYEYPVGDVAFSSAR